MTSLLKRFEEKHGDKFTTPQARTAVKDFLRTALLEMKGEMEAAKLSANQVGVAPGDDAVGSEHRAFGQNRGINKCIAILGKALAE